VSTSEKLQRELSQRKVELDKIETLDEKIATELTQLSEKLTSMNSELQTYDDIPKLRAAAEDQKAKATQAKAEAEGKIGALKARSAEAKKHHDELKAKLSADELATSLDELEAQMRHHEQTVYVLTEYIETKGAESIFEPIAEDCLNLIQGINTECIKVLAERPVFNANQFAAY